MLTLAAHRTQQIIITSKHLRFGDQIVQVPSLDWHCANSEIATILGIQAATVGKHLERIYSKLGVENRTSAASFAAELTGNTR